MMAVFKYKLNISFLTILFLGALYIAFPSINNSLDSLSYAEEMRSGSYLFRPHHLLYNAFGYLLAHLLNIKSTLSFMCVVNSIFAIACLFLMRSMLSKFMDDCKCAVILMFLGSCFGFIRFATDNEAYIIPLFFSLWASRTILKGKMIFLPSLLAATACLFHQIHFFWWLGLLFLVLLSPEKSQLKWAKKTLLYISGALIVPIAYLMVFYFTKHDSPTIIQFVFHDYFQADNVKLAFKPVTLLLTPVSFIRSFLQVHGYFIPLIQKYTYMSIAMVLAFVCFLLGLFKMKGAVSKRNMDLYSQRFAFTHLLIFIMQLIFAALSDGNAEFMVMLPFALSLYFFIKYELRLFVPACISTGVLIWNLFLALIPYHFMELSSEIPLSRFIAEHSSNVYYLKDNVRVDNILSYYHPGQKYNIKSSLKGRTILDSLMFRNSVVLTDIVNNSTPFSRASVVQNIDQRQLQKYLLVEKDSVPYDLGILHITSIINK
ncbi:hypothetical protein [uncultured Bacteroides sp.]|uniref:hypothetical protein n=1 Tax=uncultured Bacteroides sp. TaxID=162156 RepID=UPI002AAA6CF0|nr:hypothetical protein [uncultured Bacteroides sp.]